MSMFKRYYAYTDVLLTLLNIVECSEPKETEGKGEPNYSMTSIRETLRIYYMEKFLHTSITSPMLSLVTFLKHALK